MKYGRLEIIKEIRSIKYSCGQIKRKVLCKCDCGNKKEILLTSLKNGDTKSCGCLQKELASKKAIKHGMCGTRIYNTWQHMNRRCYDTKNLSYSYYGGRGITVCKKWKESFETFYKDMGDSPIGHTIERINNESNYCKKNCKWATPKEQSNNRRNNTIVKDNNKNITLKLYCEKHNLPYKLIWQRIKRDKMTFKEAIAN